MLPHCWACLLSLFLEPGELPSNVHCIWAEVVVLFEEEDTATEVAGYPQSIKDCVDLPPPVVFNGSNRRLSVVAVLIRVLGIGATSLHSPEGGEGRGGEGEGREGKGEVK